MALQPGAIKRLWWRWKSIKLPWRKRWLVGFDLKGNTFWEFTDRINIGRHRRIVEYPIKTHLSDVNLSPQWVQWLRHTRYDPPSITEQQMDEIRRAQMKQLAAQADARWAAKPSALDPPSRQTQLPSSIPEVARAFEAQQQPQSEELGSETPSSPVLQEVVVQKEEISEPTPPKAKKEFTGYKLGKGDEQQPDSWVPKPARRR